MIHNLNAKIRELEEEIKSSKTSHSRSGSSSRHKSGSMSSRTKSISREASKKESKVKQSNSEARVAKSEKKYSSQSDDSRGKSLDHDDDNEKVDKISSVASNLSSISKVEKVSGPRSQVDNDQRESPSLDIRKLEKIKSDINSGGKTPSPNQLSK